METHQLLSDILKERGAERIPAPVLNMIHAEVSGWELELQQEAQHRLRARIKKKVTKPWIGRLCLAHFNEGAQRKTRLKAGSVGVENTDREGV